MSDQPLRDALRETIMGLFQQLYYVTPVSDKPETQPNHLRWMLYQCIDNGQTWPVDKISRWVGYVQGVVTVTSASFDVMAERDRTRPLFHEAYEKMGITVPETVNRPETN